MFLDIWVSAAYYILLEIVMMVVYGVSISSNVAWLVYLVSG